ncbi:MAG: hypothetical protein U0526_02670 [Candidatus Saccharibacteria bacterium]
MHYTDSNFNNPYSLKDRFEEIKRFKEYSRQFPNTYREMQSLNSLELVEPLWKKFNEEVENVFLPKPKIDFLKNSTIRNTMFVESKGLWLETQLEYLAEKYPSNTKLKKILHENIIGRPSLIVKKYSTSHNSVHHLYHLERFKESTNIHLDDISTVVEWGGGYGNLAKIYRRLSPKSTYTIIDTPLFTSIQWLYLSSVLGEKINVLDSKRSKIIEGKINLLPIGLVKEVDLGTHNDLFISTWAISESSKAAQKFVIDNNMFEAKHVLLGYQDSTEELPEASNTIKLAKLRKLKPSPIDFIPGNYYIFG